LAKGGSGFCVRVGQRKGVRQRHSGSSTFIVKLGVGGRTEFAGVCKGGTNNLKCLCWFFLWGGVWCQTRVKFSPNSGGAARVVDGVKNGKEKSSK